MHRTRLQRVLVSLWDICRLFLRTMSRPTPIEEYGDFPDDDEEYVTFRGLVWAVEICAQLLSRIGSTTWHTGCRRTQSVDRQTYRDRHLCVAWVSVNRL